MLNGDAGNDDITISGSGGALVDGGLGNDEITAFAETEGAVLNGGEGADTIDLRGTGNIANGGLGQDVMTLLGNNTLNGGEGDYTLTATDSAAGTAATLLGGRR